MPVSYEDYWAKGIEAAINLVAGSATFRSLVGAGADVSVAKGSIVEIDGGEEAETSATIRACNNGTITRATAVLWAHVAADQPDWQNTWQTPNTITSDGMIPVAFYWRPAGITYRHELLRYVLSKTGLIARDIANQAGATGIWRRVVPQLAGLTFLDQAGYGRGTLRSQLNITYGDLP